MTIRNLSRYTIETIVYRVLNKYSPECLKEARQTPVENIMEIGMGLNVEYHDLSSDGTILGCVTMQNNLVRVYDDFDFAGHEIGVDGGTVIISNHLLNQRYLGRKNFTLGHEVGHWELHRNTGMLLTRCTDSIGSDKYKPKTDMEWVEWQADCFASCLLMPADTFKKAFLQLKDRTFSLSGEPLIPYLAQIFEVSKQAAEIRARQLFLIS